VAASEGTFSLTVSAGEADAGAARVTARGELDSASAPQLLTAVHQAMAEGQTTELTLDLSQLRFIDSTGMRALIELEHTAADGRIELLVVPAPESVTELLQVAGVADRLSLVDQGLTPSAELDFLERSDLELAADKLAPGRARASIRELLEDVLHGPELDGAALMASELVTNAVVHSAPGCDSTVGVRLVVFGNSARVEVDDPGRGFDPAEHLPGPSDVPGPGEGGRGLFVVDRLASRWGIRRHQTDRGYRFSVWFEVDRG
jgi:anti-anti-sigma factor